MPDHIKFHLDESCNNAIADALKRRGIIISTSAEAGLLSAPDEEQLAFAFKTRSVLITQDADFLRLHHSGKPHAGIAYCRQQTRSVGEMVRELVLMWELLAPEDMNGQVEFL